MIRSLEKRRQVDSEHASHYEGNGQDDGRDVHSEAGMVEEGIEHDAQALPTADKAESVERLYHENDDISW